MQKNLWWLGLLVFVFASCDTPTGPGGTRDTWSDITSLYQLQGTWVGTHNRTMPFRDILDASGYLEDDDPMTPVIKELVKDINVTIAVKATIIFDADDAAEGTMSGTTNMTVTFSGGNTELLWTTMIQEYLLAGDLPDGVTINDKNHSITMDSDVPLTEITLADFDDSQINQNGTKLKTTVNPGELDELGEFGSLVPSEVILTKVK